MDIENRCKLLKSAKEALRLSIDSYDKYLSCSHLKTKLAYLADSDMYRALHIEYMNELKNSR